MTTLGNAHKPHSLPARTPQDNFHMQYEMQIFCLYNCLIHSVMQLKNEVQLKPYPIPPSLKHLIRTLTASFTDQRKDILETPLCVENYAERFNLLLYLEEHWRRHIFSAGRIRGGTRVTWRIQHRAVEFAARHELRPVLFPTAPPSPVPQKPLPSLRLFDKRLEKNREQYEAVQHIVTGSSKPAPYLVIGPPGTGKTLTMVKAIQQIAKSKVHYRILACAYTNKAADQLCMEILKYVCKSKVFRMYAVTHNQSVPEEIKRCSNLNKHGYFYPAKEELMEYRIIITTLFTASRLVSGNIPTGHFTHVFVDEAGHALETECIVPLAGLLNPESGQVVLAGDPHRLERIVKSRLAKKYGLGVSLLERLVTHLKENGIFDKRFVTELLVKYS